MAIQGSPKFDAIQLMEIGAIDFRQGQRPQLLAKGAFVDTISGNTYGQTVCRHFSKNTLEKLQALRDAMERDLAELVFNTEHAERAVAEHSPIEPGGLGEHLSLANDAESV